MNFSQKNINEYLGKHQWIFNVETFSKEFLLGGGDSLLLPKEEAAAQKSATSKLKILGTIDTNVPRTPERAKSPPPSHLRPTKEAVKAAQLAELKARQARMQHPSSET